MITIQVTYYTTDMLNWIVSVGSKCVIKVGKMVAVDICGTHGITIKDQLLRTEPTTFTFVDDKEATMFQLKFLDHGNMYATEIIIKDDYDY